MLRRFVPVTFQHIAVPANPSAGHSAMVIDPDHKPIVLDESGIRTYLGNVELPKFWNFFGHSYYNDTLGLHFGTARADEIFRAAMTVDYGQWINRALAGSRLIIEGRAQSGWARVMQEHNPPQRVAPYINDLGAVFLGWGINDLGMTTGPTHAEIRTMYENALRACISRARISVMYNDDFSVGTRTSYGAGFTSTTGAQDYASGGTVRTATSTTNATITMTLPADYDGEPVCIQFIAQNATSGTITFSGTAGVTGTLATGIVPSTLSNRCPVVKRITNLTSANAGQTIIATVTAITASVRFDGWWLESKFPPPVIVANCGRLLTAGYSGYANSFGDTEVANLNTSISTVVSEFDSLVQIADIDSALAKSAIYISPDGSHPNEKGAARIAQSIIDAVNKLTPTQRDMPTLTFNGSAPRAAAFRKSRASGQYYGPDTVAVGTETTRSPSAGDLFTVPFIVTEGRERYDTVATRLTTAGSAAGTIRWGIYDDPDWIGWPQNLITEFSSAGAFTVTTSTGMKAFSISLSLEPGLYWLAIKHTTNGTGQVFGALNGPDLYGIVPQLSAVDLSNLTTPIGYVQGGLGSSALPTRWRVEDGVFPVSVTPKIALRKV